METNIKSQLLEKKRKKRKQLYRFGAKIITNKRNGEIDEREKWKLHFLSFLMK